MNMLAVGVEGDIGADEDSGAAADIIFSVSIEAEAISVLLLVLISDTVLTSHCSSPCDKTKQPLFYSSQLYQLIGGDELVNFSVI